ncbi:DMT family transporter [Spirosoma sp. RP8]|uniref:DMT family transporter n=1 Tax=Spirosoma liriopis TaxID=2937440 RepID=A0ABT0HJL1_9BACT|nr:EamA family transporter [Spirosoma liriopis]MCK8492175.1 DMT family transporter [Spirosoma liriopis]
MFVTFVSITSLAVLIRIVANPLSNVFQKQLTHRSADPLFIISATYGFLALACLTVWPQLQVEGLPKAFWLSMLVVGLFAMLGNVFLVKALHIGDLSVLGPINAYKSVVGLVVGIFLLNEIPGWWGLAGVVLIVVGSYVVLSNKQQRKGFSWRIFGRQEVKLRLAALVFSAIDGAFLKKAIVLSSPTIAFFYWCVFGFAFTLIWMLIVLKDRWQEQTSLLFSQKSTYLALFLTVGVTQVASNIALAEMQVGYALALFQTSALISVLFGHRFFNEQGILRKLIGAAIMVAGAILITVLG